MLLSITGCSKRKVPDADLQPSPFRYAVADPGPGIIRLTEIMLALKSKMSCGLILYLDAERRWDQPSAWIITLAIENISKEPISIPMVALNPKYAIVTTQREGEEHVIPYTGSHMPIENDCLPKEGNLQIPSGASLVFALPLPQGHPFHQGIKPGKYLFKWPFHPEATCRIVLSESGTIKTLEQP